jgi:hypothetical protein
VRVKGCSHPAAAAIRAGVGRTAALHEETQMRAMMILTLGLMACGSSESPESHEGHDGHDEHAEHGDHGDDKAHDGHAKAGKRKGGKAKAGAPKAKVFFTEPADGATVSSPVKLVFGVEGMEVRPAGELAENTGHHHVIIGPAGIPTGEAVPADEKHIHFGKGQTEAEIELPPGEHKLTMQFADGNHMSYGEVMATTITITVE